MHESRYSDEVLPAAKYGSYTDFERISEVQVSVAYVRDETGDIHPLMPPVRTLLDTAVVNRFGVTMVDQDETLAESAVADVFPTNMRHFPNGLGQYKTYRSNVDVVDSYGNRNNAAFLSRDADAWLMARDCFDLFGNLKPRKSLRISNPDEYNFHDATTGHDRQYNYTVNVGTKYDLTTTLTNVADAGDARRIAKLQLKHDAAGIRSRMNRTHEVRRQVSPNMTEVTAVTELAVSFRGRVVVGHGRWITPVGKSGRPSTQQTRDELVAAQLSDVTEVTRDEAGEAAYGRLMNGARNLRLATTEGVVITVRRSGASSIKVDVKRAQKRVKGVKSVISTTCSHESYVSSAIDRCLAKLT